MLGFIKKLFSKQKATPENIKVKMTFTPLYEYVGEYEPKAPIKPVKDVQCPYCDIFLEKIPQAKTKCKSCENYIYSITDNNRQKKLVTEDQKKKIIELKNYPDGRGKNGRIADTIERALESGHNLVWVSSHKGESEICKQFSGKIFCIKASKSNKYPLLSEAIQKGLFRDGCRHSLGVHIETNIKFKV